MKKILLLLLFLPYCILAQNALSPLPLDEIWAEKSGEAIFPIEKLSLLGDEQNHVSQAGNFLKIHLKGFFQSNNNLILEEYKISPIGTHISFTQAFFGAPIYGTNVKINIESNGKISSVLHKLVSTKNWKNVTHPEADREKVMGLIGGNIISKIDKCWYFDGNSAHAAYLVDFGKTDGSLHKEIVISINYEVLYQLDKHRYNGKDTMATANVFFPDPLTSARKPYGAPYADAGDSGIFALDYERVPLNFPVVFRNNLFYLENEFAVIAELSAPATDLTTSKNGFFNYSRSHHSFEEVNIMANIYHFRKHIKTIGFDTLGKKPLKIDAHALNGADQSEFDFFQGNLKLLFGDGGIDDAEDADVIIHEYCHFLSYSASGDNAYGSDRLAIEEGMSDYFACSYSKNISRYNWQKVYTWDGNETWEGRSCVTSKNYKKDLSGNRYRDGELWAGTLMEIEEEIGRDKTDALMLGTLYSLSKYITMPNAAKLLIHVDSILNGGENFRVIAQKFVKNGLLPETYISVSEEKNTVVNTKIVSAFFSSHDIVYIKFDKPQSGHITLLNIQGKEITSKRFSQSDAVNIYVPGLKPGMYILNLNANDIQRSLKVVK